MSNKDLLYLQGALKNARTTRVKMVIVLGYLHTTFGDVEPPDPDADPWLLAAFDIYQSRKDREDLFRLLKEELFALNDNRDRPLVLEVIKRVSRVFPDVVDALDRVLTVRDLATINQSSDE